MEFLLVTYPGERDVFVDGEMTGKTNRILPWMLAEGMHVVDLGSPRNYEPAAVHVALRDTAPATPCVVDFAAAGHRAAPPANRPYVFVAMDFGPRLLSRFYDAIQPAAKAAGLPAVRTDRIAYAGDVLTHLLRQIEHARLVIADLLPENANVCLEVGYAWGRDRPTVLLVSNPASRRVTLPFDLRQQRYLQYRTIAHLREVLQDELVGIDRQPGG